MEPLLHWAALIHLLPEHPGSVVPHPFFQNQVLCYSASLCRDNALAKIKIAISRFM